MTDIATSRAITSRVGRKPISVPSGVEVKIDGRNLLVKSAKHQANLELHPFVSVVLEDNAIKVLLNDLSNEKITGADKKTYRSISGTTRSNIANLIKGVHTGFEKRLQLVGVGYRAAMKGKSLALSLGYSHPTEVTVPEGITIETPTPTEIIIKGSDSERVGELAAVIRKIRSPEPYKGKGIRYAGEVIELKETKKK